MKKGKGLKGKTPGKERREIGTPAGESPEEGRKRHGTEEMGRKGGSSPAIPHRGIDTETAEVTQRSTLVQTDISELEVEGETGGYTEEGIPEIEAKSNEMRRRKLQK